ncbi:MAG: pyridoxal-phosphate dependent enzyme [Thermodesulfobacteriota bacterium]
MTQLPKLHDVYRTHARIKPLIFETPLLTSVELADKTGAHTDVLLVQLSGGGLLAGMAMAAKSINPGIHIVGVSLEQSPAMLESLKAGTPIQVEEKDSIADSLLGGIGLDNRYTLPMVEKYVDEHVLVSEEGIKDAMFYLFEKHRLIAEGAAAVGVGVLMHRKIDVKDKKVVTLLSGSSILTEKELRQAICVDSEAVAAIEAGFSALAEDKATMPPIMHIEVPEHQGDVDIKAAYVQGLDHLAVKVGAGFFNNHKIGLPNSPAMMVAISARTGFVEAVLLDNAYLTDVRTGAAGAVAAKYLAPEDIKIAGVVGAGAQGRYQIEGLRCVRKFDQLLAFDLDRRFGSH